MAKVSVFGLGYVGCVSAACLATSGHQVVGVDVDDARVRSVRNGRSPVEEPGLHELVAAEIAHGRLIATTDAAAAVRDTDLALICVGTPGHGDGQPDTSAIREAASQIGLALSGRTTPFTVVLRSTCLPGTIDEVLMPALGAAAGNRASVTVGANPEFLREGSAIHDFHAPPMILIGTAAPDTASRIADLYRNVEAPVVTTSIRNAEAVKYASNAFHAMKVCFANEIAEVAARTGADPREVMRIFAMDRKLNLSEAYLRPGFAFGGPCLAKDVSALAWMAEQQLIDAPLLAAIQPSNVSQIRRSVDAVLATGRRRVGLVGLGFKADARDLRGSPVTALANALVNEGCDVRMFEPLFRLDRDADELSMLAERVCADLGTLLAHADVVVLGPGVAADDVERLRSIAAGRVVIDLSAPWRHGPIGRSISSSSRGGQPSATPVPAR